MPPTSGPGGSAADVLGRQLDAVLPRLHGRARSLCCDPVEAEDLVQDTIERALRFAALFDPGSNLGAWMSHILQNLFLSGCRRTAVERRALESLARDPCAWTCAVSLPAMTGLCPSMTAALDSLPIHHATVVTLVDVYDYTYQDAAVALRVPIGTVMSRLHRARRKLAGVLIPEASR